MSGSGVVEDWVDGTTGLRCVVVSSPDGHPQWFVSVGPEHPWHRRDHDGELCGHPGCRDHTVSSAIEVRPELTYSGPSLPGLTALDDEWWFGFEATEGEDDDGARRECETLARQLMLAGLAWGMF